MDNAVIRLDVRLNHVDAVVQHDPVFGDGDGDGLTLECFDLLPIQTSNIL